MDKMPQQSRNLRVSLALQFLLVAIALMASAITSSAQQLTQQWVNTVPKGAVGLIAGGPAVAADSNDNSYVAGNVCADSACQTTVLQVVKYAKDGTTAWTAQLSGAPSGSSEGAAVAVDAAGNVYAAGIAAITHNGPQAGTSQLVTVKFSSAGQQLWASYATSSDAFGYIWPVLAVDSAGNSYVSVPPGDLLGPITTIKYDTNGNQVWLSTYSVTSLGFHCNVMGIKVDTQGNAYVAAGANDASGFVAFNTGLILKYGASGNLLWGYQASHTLVNAFTLDAQGNSYVASNLGPPGNATNATLAEQVTKLDSNGNVLWTAQYAPSNIPTPLAIGIDTAGNAYVTGYVQLSPSTSSHEYSTSKFDSTGKFVWEQRYATQNSIAVGLVLDQQSNVYITGTSNNNAITIEYDTNGNQLSLVTYKNDSPVGIALGNTAIFVAGSFQNGNSSSSSQWITIEYTQASSVTANISPTNLSFASQTVNATSSPQTITIANNGSAAMNITAAPAISGANAADFAIASGTTCTNGASVAANSSCVINITFTPSATGSAGPAALTITDDAGNSPQTVSLTGTATAAPAPAVSFAPISLTFASQPDGTTSGPQTVTLTNTGNASLSISSVTITGANAAEFAPVNVSCESTLAAGASCVITVDFKPTQTGKQTAAITVADNANASPQTVTLMGTGAAAAAPAVGLTPNSLTFTAQVVGTTSQAQSITLMNTGNATLTISGITVSGSDAKSFSVGASTCGKSLTEGTKCAIPISFAPTGSGAQTANLSITDNATPATQTMSLTGTGSNFALSSSNTSATVSPGQTASYTVNVSPTAFSGSVAFTCSGAPASATCAITPASVNFTGSTPAQVAVTVATTASSGDFPLRIPLGPQRLLLISSLAAVLITTLEFRRLGRYRLKPSLVLMLVLLIATLGCGGMTSTHAGSNPGTTNPTQPSNPTNPSMPGSTTGTPPGTSTITMTATSGSTVRTLPLALTVN